MYETPASAATRPPYVVDTASQTCRTGSPPSAAPSPSTPRPSPECTYTGTSRWSTRMYGCPALSVEGDGDRGRCGAVVLTVDGLHVDALQPVDRASAVRRVGERPGQRRRADRHPGGVVQLAAHRCLVGHVPAEHAAAAVRPSQREPDPPGGG